ncbi:hypothetical protein PIB30_058190 [Stylosanthes scabra]|uniref:Putative plant transposon protein domain-containing protein n=1 Tax=Stylosanthes scabra TaxID=79078 RepID=A0ABU6XHU1_9FABA|nr:hypothetical protein [Stylosanthes scabra]
MDTIRQVLKIRGRIGAEMNFRKRMILDYHDLDVVIRDICVPIARWACEAGGAPQHLKRHDLLPILTGWHEFIIHSILPTTNKSEITLKRAILIHVIMKSQEVRAEKLIEEAMSEIVGALHLEKLPLAFPNVVARLCEAAGVLQHDIWADQTKFYQDVRARQEQQQQQYQQLQVDQAQFHKEFTNQKRNFSTHMGKNMYTCWGLQQGIPSLAPVPATDIAPMIKRNVKENKGLFDGMARPWPVGESSAGGKGKAPLEKDVAQEPNADSNDD